MLSFVPIGPAFMTWYVLFRLLVAFFLKSYSTAPIQYPEGLEELASPYTSSETQPYDSTVLVITKKEILLDGVSAGPLNALSNENDSVRPLDEHLATSYEQQNRLLRARGDTVNNGLRIAIIADRETPFRLLDMVVRACRREGFGRVSFVLLKDG